MTSEEMIRLCRAHTIYSWSRQGAVDPLPIAGAEGVWFWTPEGERYLDFNSQIMSVNAGHAHPRIVAAIREQVETLAYAYPGSATEVRARLGELLSEVLPGDLDRFFFTLGGAEANENAIKAARAVTGRHKILARYRSYHGATHGAMTLTGEPRRWTIEPGIPGVVHVLDPEPWSYSFGATEEERAVNNLRYLEEVIQAEGPHHIAAMFVESITGTNGVLLPPKGYLRGLKDLLDRHGILLVCDEVMAGFGRSGRWFGFEHGDIVPDIVTMAKGLTSSYAPLGCMALSDRVASHFEDEVFWGGLTYTAHPIGLAAAAANIEVLRDEGLVDQAARLEPVMREEMDSLRERHPSVAGGRCVGLFGMVDLRRNEAGEPVAPFNGSSPVMERFKERLLEERLFSYVRWSSFMTNPPLCISEGDLREGFARIDRALDVVDEAFEG
ncbi:MAG: aminotransferase class III-fold pyridoxal phosphate-dependent enzyme [Myxococcota bacterium]